METKQKNNLLHTAILLEDLEALTDPNSIHYDEDIALEKEIVKNRILSGEIFYLENDGKSY
jgi:hypothetical protein